MKKYYICDRERKIKDKMCQGWGCKDGFCCQHTLDEYYAKNPPEKRKFETVNGDLWEYEEHDNKSIRLSKRRNQ